MVLSQTPTVENYSDMIWREEMLFRSLHVSVRLIPKWPARSFAGRCLPGHSPAIPRLQLRLLPPLWPRHMAGGPYSGKELLRKARVRVGYLLETVAMSI